MRTHNNIMTHGDNIMKPIKAMLYLILPLTLFILVACTRTYPDGETQEVGWIQATIDKFIGNPNRKEQEVLAVKTVIPNPDNLLAITKANEIIKKENKSIEDENEKIVKHNKGAQEDQENPDEGLLALLGIAATAGGVGWLNAYLKKKTMEDLRDLAVNQKHVVYARYEGAKAAAREGPTTIEKIKLMAGEAAELIMQQQELLKDHPDAISAIKDIVKDSTKSS